MKICLYPFFLKELQKSRETLIQKKCVVFLYDCMINREKKFSMFVKDESKFLLLMDSKATE